MWPGQDRPGGPQQPNPGGGQDANPYQQPGYQQPNPYQQQGPGPSPQEPWNAPTVSAGPPVPPGGGGRRTKVIAVVAAAVVVVAAVATGAVLLGGGEDDSAAPGPTRSTGTAPRPAEPEDSDDRGTDGAPEPTVPGWKTVVNPRDGLAFDVPPQWDLKSADFATWVSEHDDPSDTPLVAMLAPAVLKERWCASDDDKDGRKDHTPLGLAGTKRNKTASSTAEIARNNATAWVYGGYAQPDKKKVTTGPAEPYTTASGLKGSLVTAASSGVEKKGACDTDGKATTFGFKNSEGEFLSWSFHGVKGVKEEIPDRTVREILRTVREYRAPQKH
ncbi:hypothetical protein AB0I84_39195 [Streptomyces spectabilis]|uniref:hypothetical protein n=1 Tax=Streptomyces spectabilis TaxID=68270 RepID=UPI003410C229